MRILGIESSCDETAAAVLDSEKGLLSSVVWTQAAEHRPFGGVVPEIAARAHLEKIDIIIKDALAKADTKFSDLSAIAAACGPGLIGGVIIGAMTGKAIASVLDIPFIAVNHLEGHALAAKLETSVPFPYLLLLTSGGHCQLLEVLGIGKYKLLGKTIDDAAGEAFDKVAKMLDLGYPGGGALVEKAALSGDSRRFNFPRPLAKEKNMDFSFSGLKTAVLHAIKSLPAPLTAQDKSDICASFQAAVIDVMSIKVARAIDRFSADFSDCDKSKTLVVAGGVAANKSLRQALQELAEQRGFSFVAPSLKLCTDNGAMIALAGLERLKLGLTDSLAFRPRPRWPLYE